jgi:hypothetical protein
MGDLPDDLDRLHKMSPIDGPEIPPRSARVRRPPWMTRQIGMVLTGVGLILVCGFLLFYAFELASMTNPNDPDYRSEVLGKMFGLEYVGLVVRPATFGLLLGLALIVFGIYRPLPRS